MSLLKHVSVFFVVFAAMWQLAVGEEEEDGPPDKEELLQFADADQDGRVTLDEFITMIGAPAEEIPTDMDPEFRNTQQGTIDYLAKVAPTAFKKADRDGDGYVNIDEIVDLNNLMMQMIEEYPTRSKEL
eukprot:TRINITY_DN84_c0_g1_i1.p1 TRINITY_DN84_c0_g1~~TRINITY_DN84_c0_g1_i1.p1  ORF type:complete len:129 (-),score=43.90 TRINITY_DN84_c0_g1_i1:16-402(-)